MGFDVKKWQNRIRHRADLSTFLTHLTRSNEQQDAIDVLIQILKQGKIIGSNNLGFIIGNDTAVCFQDAPLYGISQNVLHEQLHREELGGKVRYIPIGISFKKRFVFEKGGRPVFYEKKEKAMQILDEKEHWRIVSFDLDNEENIVDWTHEREWRVKGDFTFELSDAYVLLTNEKAYQEFISRAGLEIVEKLKGIVTLDPVLT